MNITPNFKGWVGASYSRKNRRAVIAVEMPYQDLFSASKEEVIRLMEVAYLEGIEQIADLRLTAPFDHQAFKADVQAIFAQEDWYKPYEN